MAGRALMIQGTGSDVGKSVLTAALCRIFVRQGYRVAPFKAQNMALNSFVTLEGGEIGRAQAVQAAAARAEPSVHMNPILMKPREDTSAQIMVHGYPLGNYSASEYIELKKSLIPKIKESLDYLKGNYDIIMIEGAGSPAEINLREHDLVNMATAFQAEAPVLLVADIDRGGVFASIVGTFALLEEIERDMIKGVIVNRFRGQLERLKPGLDEVEGLIKRPVIGVVPYYTEFHIPEEDRYFPREQKKNKKKDVEIAVLHLPHISNFTDFDPLEETEGLVLNYVTEPGELDGADAVIIPGSKNTIEDLDSLWKQGWVGRIKSFYRHGGTVVGICGGYQMLGHQITDPGAAESSIHSIKGMGLLDITTEFYHVKVTSQVWGEIKRTGDKVVGYEIHMGKTRLMDGVEPLLVIQRRGNEEVLENDGAVSKDGRIFGTYLHGIFDQVPFRIGFVNKLRVHKGLPPLEVQGQLSQFDVWERSYEMLADLVSSSLDMKFIEKLVFNNHS